MNDYDFTSREEMEAEWAEEEFYHAAKHGQTSHCP